MGAFLPCFESHNSLGWIIMPQNRNAFADSFLSSPRAHHRRCQNVRWGPRALQGAPIEKAEPGLLPRPGRVKPPLQPGGPQRNPHYFGSWSSQLCCGSEEERLLTWASLLPRAPSPTWFDSSRSTSMLNIDMIKIHFASFPVKCHCLTFAEGTWQHLAWLETPFSASFCLFKSTSSYNLECLCCLYIQIKLPFQLTGLWGVRVY